MSSPHQSRPLPAESKEKKAMKLPRGTLIWRVYILCFTLLIFSYLTRKSL